MNRFSKRISRGDAPKLLILAALPILLLCLPGCKGLFNHAPQYMYVAMPQATLRDSTATVYTKLVMLQNGERVQVLGFDRGFVKVRSQEGLEGWIERRFLVGQDIYDSFAQLAAFHAHDALESHGVARDDVNMHITPAREAEKLYQLKQGDTIEMLARVSTLRPEAVAKTSPAVSRATPSSVETSSGTQQRETLAMATEQPTVKDGYSQSSSGQNIPQSQPAQSLEDWWLVRDIHGHVGWIVARLIAVDVPIAISEAGFAQGQRPVATKVLTTITDPSINGSDKRVPIYLMLFTENKDGLPYDYDHVRVFVWNMRHSPHRYELSYYERGVAGMLPVKVNKENFVGEGEFPVFTLRIKTDSGEEERRYKLDGTMVKRVLASEVRATVNPSEHQLSRGTDPGSSR